MKRPLPPILFAYISGIIAGNYFYLSPVWAIAGILGASLAILICIASGKKKVALALSPVIFALFGLLYIGRILYPSFPPQHLVHFAGEVLLAHPLDESYKATNKQLIEKMKWVHGTVIKGRELRTLKRKFIAKEWSGERATKLELLECVREGDRNQYEQRPSLYRFTRSFMQLLDSYHTLEAQKPTTDG